MKLIKSTNIEEYVKKNKKEAENEIPYILKKLINNTVKEIKGIDIPSGDNTIQTGFDGIVSFRGTNKYLGDKTANIEIGTNADYIKKANDDIKKREPKNNENFIFITPYRWNNRKISKDSWISSKKNKYKWNDIKIIDASVLEDWLEEDFLTTKYFLEKMGISTKKVYSIGEKEKEFIKKTKRGISLEFFDYDDKEYEKILSELKKEHYNITAPTREEGLLVTLYYLRKIGKENDTLIIEDELAWKNIVSNNLVKNSILIPNFYHEEGLETLDENVTLFLHDNDELINDSDYIIKQRTISNLNKCLELYYKKERNQTDYEAINLIINKSLGKYVPLKRELFKEVIKPKWYNESNIKLYLYLFFVNNFKTYDMKLFEDLGLNIEELKEKLKKLTKEKDPFIVYYKYWDQYRVVNIYNAIDCLGSFIDESDIEKLCNIARKVLFYLEPKYLPENIDKKYYIENSAIREYSDVVKEGILRSLIITKLYLETENKNNLVQKLENLIDEYYNSIENEGQFLSLANIASKLVEFDYEKYLKKIQNSVTNKEFEKMFDLSNKDTIFSSNEYCNILWGIEKAINKRDYICDAIETLALLSEMKNTEYKNMANKPIETLRVVFLGWDNLTCLDIREKVKLLEMLIKKHNELGKELMKKILPNNSCTWSPLQKPEFDKYDEVNKIKYVSEQKEYFEKYYMLYLNNYVNKLDDLICIYDELYFVDFNCFEDIKTKTLSLIEHSSDKQKLNFKEKISERLRGYEKFNNQAWNLTEKQFDFLTEIKNKLIYDNSIYDYLYLYQYNHLKDEEDEPKRKEAMEILKNNIENENILFENCNDKRRLISDIYKYCHNGQCNIKFLRKLFINYSECVEFYLRMIYLNETVENIIKIYNNHELEEIPIENKIFILSNMGYNEFIYNEIKGRSEEATYWKKLNIFNGEKNDFVYDSCFKYGNYEICLDMIYEQSGKYEEKCKLLEKMQEIDGYKNFLDEYRINKIFESFYNSNDVSNYERLAKLEIYYSPILDNKTYFLSKEASKYPSIVAEMAEIIYKDEEGNFSEFKNKEKIVSNCYTKLRELNIDFENANALEWCEKFIKAMIEKKRSHIMYNVLGRLLAKSGTDKDDKMYPTKSVRMIIEYYKSKELAHSFAIERYNSRGVHFIGVGEEELSLYKQHLEWSNKMKIEYPETSKILKNIAENYRQEAKMLRDEANYV
ncbi:MAG: hypothetical protein IJN90_01425 [Bacilli bacterium]|nr:hypothetical protein [Bacilli bacterium]